MATFRLKFTDDGIGMAKEVEFEAGDASHALTIAHQEAPDRTAELWEGDLRLCTIRREGTFNELWRVG